MSSKPAEDMNAQEAEKAISEAVQPDDRIEVDKELGIPVTPAPPASKAETVQVQWCDWTGIHNLPYSEGALILDISPPGERALDYVLTSCPAWRGTGIPEGLESKMRCIEGSITEHMDEYMPDVRNRVAIVSTAAQEAEGLLSAIAQQVSERLAKPDSELRKHLRWCKSILVLRGGVKRMAEVAPHLCGGRTAAAVLGRTYVRQAKRAIEMQYPKMDEKLQDGAIEFAMERAKTEVDKSAVSASHGGTLAYPAAIEPWLFLGSLWHAKQTTALLHLGITHVVNVASQVPCYHSENGQMLDGGMSDLLQETHGLKPSLPEAAPVPDGSDVDTGDKKKASASSAKSGKGGEGAASGSGAPARASSRDPRWLGIQYFHVKVEDEPSQQMLGCWEAASSFIAKASLQPDARVLVHCAAGVSRSTSTIVHYLMKREMGLLPAARAGKTAASRPAAGSPAAGSVPAAGPASGSSTMPAPSLPTPMSVSAVGAAIGGASSSLAPASAAAPADADAGVSESPRAAEKGNPATTVGAMPKKPEAWVEQIRSARKQARPNIGFMLQLRAHHRGMNQLRIARIKRRQKRESGMEPAGESKKGH